MEETQVSSPTTQETQAPAPVASNSPAPQAQTPAPVAPTTSAAASTVPTGAPHGGRGRGGQQGGGRSGGGRFGGRGGRGDRGGRGGREPSEYDEEVLQIDRVTRVVKGGRRMRFRATVVVGNRNGKVGLGIGKSHEVVGAIQKAIRQAKKDMLVLPLKNGTIPHEIKTKFKSARILIMPAAPGTGIIAGGAVRKIAELAGIKNLLSKIFGCRNRVTNAQCTMIALKNLRQREVTAHKV